MYTWYATGVTFIEIWFNFIFAFGCDISSSIIDLYNDSDPLYLNGTSFMFGVGIVGSHDSVAFDDTYLNLKAKLNKNVEGRQIYFF